jgi:hypothetical protein
MQSDVIDSTERKLIFPGLSYSEALVTSGLENFEIRRQNQIRELLAAFRKQGLHLLTFTVKVSKVK